MFPAIDIILISLGFLLLMAGLAGAFIPILPGPPLSFLGFLLIHFSSRMAFPSQVLLTLGAITLVITLADYLLPVWGTRWGKGTKHGLLGATLGLLTGILFFAPLGVIVGPFLGAWLAEKVNGKQHKEAFRSAMGSFMGLMLGIVLKFVLSIVFIWYSLKEFILSFA